MSTCMAINEIGSAFISTQWYQEERVAKGCFFLYPYRFGPTVVLLRTSL